MMLRAPWLKRIDLTTGACTALPLDDDAPFVLPRGAPQLVDLSDEFGELLYRAADVADLYEERVQRDGASWFHVTAGARWWLMHGSVVRTTTDVYVFMEHHEARHEELEAALSRDAMAADVYADWLLEQGDPFGAALKPEVAKERGPAGLWWLEGLERSGAVATTVRDGFVREVRLGTVPLRDLAHTLHRICHLRACVALERLTIDPRVFHERAWSEVLGRALWTRCRWPRTLRELVFAPMQSEEPGRLDPGLRAAFQQRLALVAPALTVIA